MGNGNVLLSRGFQFVETVIAKPGYDGQVWVWTPVLPQKFELLKMKWIYAFRYLPGENKGMLAAEYYADKDGALTFVPGNKRRFVDKPNKPDGKPVREVTLPLVIQGDPIAYKFVVTRGRMPMEAIWDMENSLHPIYRRIDLNAADNFHAGANGQQFVAVIDILSVGEGLHRAYLVARNTELQYTVGLTDDEKKAARLQTQKYRLAKMIKDSLLAPNGEMTNPLSVQNRLAENGQPMLHFIDEHESKTRRLWWSSRHAARDLALLLNSPLWIFPGTHWYMATEQSSNDIGHFWLDASFKCIERLSETPEGAAVVHEMVRGQETGLLSFLLPPRDAANQAAKAEWERRFAWSRKAATSAVICLGETIPAVIAAEKATENAARRIVETLKGILYDTQIEYLAMKRYGIFAVAIQTVARPIQIRVSYPQAKDNLEEIITKGKPHWPEGTTAAKASDVLGRLFVLCEIANFYLNWSTLRQMDANTGTVERWKLRAEVVGAGLDLTVALEDPIGALAKKLDSIGGSAAKGAGAGAEAGEEVVGAFGKFASPVLFKALGAASATIDCVVYFLNAREHHEHGQIEVSYGEFIVSGGNALLIGASIVNGVGYMMAEAAATAAELAAAATVTAGAALVLLLAVIVVAIGYAIISYFGTSEWQEFTERCSFGKNPRKAGSESWSGGDFSTWTDTMEGYELQIQVLTAMLCGFKVTGDRTDAQTIWVYFNTFPPRSHLEIEFEISYDNGVTRKPTYWVDLDTLHCDSRGDAQEVSECAGQRTRGALTSLVVRADRPGSLGTARVTSSSCEVRLRYARQSSVPKVTTGAIPILTPLKYKLYDGTGYVQIAEANSLNAGPE